MSNPLIGILTQCYECSYKGYISLDILDCITDSNPVICTCGKPLELDADRRFTQEELNAQINGIIAKSSVPPNSPQR